MRRGLAQCSYLFVPHESINLQNKTQTMRLLASLCSQENFDQWECSMDPSHPDLCLWQCGLHIGPYGKANLLATSADFRRCTKVKMWNSFFLFPIRRNVLSGGSFKKLKRRFEAALILESCESKYTILLSLSIRIWPNLSGHRSALSMFLCMAKFFKGDAGCGSSCSFLAVDPFPTSPSPSQWWWLAHQTWNTSLWQSRCFQTIHMEKKIEDNDQLL